MNRIVLSNNHRDQLEQVEAWCRDNVGKGSRRFRVNTWMGTDDWFYYEDIPPAEQIDQDEAQDLDIEDYDLVFVFRREEDSTMFAIRWA
jgi:hypothetical protein